MKLLLAIPIAVALIACAGPNTAAGKYSIHQENNAFGEGAEKAVLDLRADKTYDLKMGQLTLFKGTWSETADTVNLTNSGGNMAVSYRVSDGKLLPQKDGKEITFWRFVRK